MTSPADLQAATVAALKAEATADLQVLQAGLSVVTNPASTVQQCADAITTMSASLASPDRQQAVVGLGSAWTQLVASLQGLIATATLVADQ